MKKVEKTFKKGIDKGKVVWYNSQAVRPKGKTESTRSLKIEQQERSTKHIKIVQVQDLVERVIYSTK